MITKITGRLTELSETAAYLQCGYVEHEVFVPDFVRRQLGPKRGEEVTLRTIEFIEGNPQKGRLTPRLIGFLTPVEREFFELVCSVDGVGVKKALRAMVRPVRDVAAAIEESDVQEITTLPGIGAAMAERIVAKLRRKMTRFALMPERDLPDGESPKTDVERETVEALVALGHSQVEARKKVEAARDAGAKGKTVETLLTEIYRLGRT
ncbi:Holliday junction branch migration protein RuvA [Alienimonas californiensis]|uniref:Holliday junction branch migration complex subunit RuvA n=1 Tax=Alienimonas californiensis TaxID=2527989 RepID=A0A517PFN0_9PLAN|nr:Holliday junction branch migration protein RuvA [Alienimonas californiensis]QDT18192.1 Holliday junction ATP-dependent DNA helicase RuvA [Alienimonas californiensis]